MQFGDKTLEQWLQSLNLTKSYPEIDVNVASVAPVASVVRSVKSNPHVGATDYYNVSTTSVHAPNGNTHKELSTTPTTANVPDVGSTAPVNMVAGTREDVDRKSSGQVESASILISNTPPSTPGNEVEATLKEPSSTSVQQQSAVVSEMPLTNARVATSSVPNGRMVAKPAPLSWAQRVAKNVPVQPETPTRISSPPAPLSPVVPQQRVLPPLPPRVIRGMVNAGNTCFVNVTLQALMGCEDFRRYFLNARNPTDPLLRRMASLASDMSLPPDAKPQIIRDTKSLPNVAEPLMPEWASDIFPSTLPKPVDGGRAVQEDAQEYLGFLLNKLHDILVAQSTGDNNKQVEEHGNDDDGGEWQQMTKKGRPVTIRPVNNSDTSAIADIFGFVLRAEIKRPKSTATMTRETNMFIQLDISSGMIRNVDDALRDYFRAERIEGLANGESQDIRKSCYMETLPKVLILHLKRFAHTRETNRQNKVGRSIGVNEELEIPSVGLYSPATMVGARKYRLTAVVTHAGKDLRGGHYHGDVRVRNGDRDIWVSCDDSKVSQVDIQKVLRRQAYLLFYSRVNVANGVRR